MGNPAGQITVGGKKEFVLSVTSIPIGPTWHSQYFLGADGNGRDVAVRLLYGGRNSLEIGFVATLITMVVALILGVVSGYFRGIADGIINRLLDIIWAYPAVLLGVTLGTVLAVGGIGPLKGTTLMVPAVVIGIVYIPYVAKPVRGQVLTLREREFVDAARQQGLSDIRIMFSEILPNLASTIIVFIPLILANAILLESGLTFLGAGVQPPEPVVGDDDQRRDQHHPGGVPQRAGAGHHARAGGAVDQRVRRRTARRAGPARQGPYRPVMTRSLGAQAAMTRFVVRRVLAMVLVMFVISLITFLLFEAIPNGDPALRLAGRSATAAEIQQIRVKYGFNQPLYVQYARTMKNIFTGQAYSYTQGFNVLDEIRAGLPATLSLALGAGVIWLLTSIVVGTLAAIKAGRYTDRILTVLSMMGVSFPPFFLGAVLIYYLGYKANIFPLGNYVPLTQNPVQWLTHLHLAVVHALGAVRRLLLARPALDDPRHDQRGLHPHRARQGHVRVTRCWSATSCATA